MIARYLQLHLQTLGGALGRIGSTPIGAVLNVLVIAIALALPAALQVLIANAAELSARWDSAADFTVYLDINVDEDDARTLNARIANRNDVDSTRFISRVEALAEFKARSGFGDALDALNENPLPHAIVVRPSSSDLDAIERLANELVAIDEVDVVQLDSEWIARLNGMLDLTGRIVDIVTVLLAAAVVLVIGNTIRLEINNRRTEVEVLKLVGATDGFVRRPFLYMGFCLGLLGALAAALMILIGLLLLARPVRNLAALYATEFSLSGLTLAGFGILVGGGAVLGWAGAWLAAARHLRAIEPA